MSKIDVDLNTVDYIGKQPRVILLLERYDRLSEQYLTLFTNRDFNLDNLVIYITDRENQTKSEVCGKIKSVLAFHDVALIISTSGSITKMLLDDNIIGETENYKVLSEVTSIGGSKLKFIQTINPLALDDASQIEALNVTLGEVYSDLYSITMIDGAELVPIDKFIWYAKKVKSLYEAGKISYVGFDIETNTLDFWLPWAKICMYSMADPFTEISYSVAMFHPEVIFSPIKKTMWKLLLEYLGSRLVKDEDYVKMSEKLEKWIKVYRGTISKRIWVKHPVTGEVKVKYPQSHVGVLKDPYHDVTSEVEDRMMDAVADLAKTINVKTGARSRYKTMPDHVKDAWNNFCSVYSPQLKVLNHLVLDTEYQKKMNELDCLLEDVLTEIPVVGHNVKFDISFLNYNKSIGIKNKPIKVKADTYAKGVAIHGLESGMRLDLETLSNYYLKVENAWKTEFHTNPKLNKTKRFDSVPLNILGPYAAADSLATMKLYEYIQPTIEKMNNEMLDEEQNLAISMFARAEAHGFTLLTEFAEKLYYNITGILTDAEQRIKDHPMVKLFVSENSDKESIREEGFKINNNSASSHKAAILFGKRYLGFESLKTTEAGNASCNVDDVLIPLKKQIQNTLKKYEEDPNNCWDENSGQKVDEGYKQNKLEVGLELVSALIDYSVWFKLWSAYLNPIFDYKEGKVKDTFRSQFNLVGATLTGRMSSGFHTMPRQGNIRQMYGSCWGSYSNRKTVYDQEIGQPYIPEHGLVEVEYEDGTKETIRYSDVCK